MNRVRLAVRVVGLILALLALGMLLQPTRQRHTAYQKATDNLAVPSAQAEDCTLNQLRCVSQGGQGVCITGGDPNEGCVTIPPQHGGCEGCIE